MATALIFQFHCAHRCRDRWWRTGTRFPRCDQSWAGVDCSARQRLYSHSFAHGPVVRRLVRAA